MLETNTFLHGQHCRAQATEKKTLFYFSQIREYILENSKYGCIVAAFYIVSSWFKIQHWLHVQ